MLERDNLKVAEFCVGGGGQALGLENAGFECVAAVEIDTNCCETLKFNRPKWNVINEDMKNINGAEFGNVDLFAAGVPCPPFSIAGKQLGTDDERDLFPEALRIIDEMKPRAVLLENVPGFATRKFTGYRHDLQVRLFNMGYESDWRLLQASDFEVPQLRPRFILVALPLRQMQLFQWPTPYIEQKYVGETLRDLMMSRNWPGAEQWATRAQKIAPTIVGGSKKHGGPDLGPTRARKQWSELGVDGLGIANEAPGTNFPIGGNPRLTVRMVARIQGFPDFWNFCGKKTAAYRQVGNAFPPPVAFAVGKSIRNALNGVIPEVSFKMHEQLKIFDGQFTKK